MRYLLLLHHPESLRYPPGTPEFAESVAAFDRFHDELTRRGVSWTGEPLLPDHAAKTVRVRAGQTLVSDGPFAELKEQLGGYYIVDVADIDAALALAAQIPWAREGTVDAPARVARRASRPHATRVSAAPLEHFAREDAPRVLAALARATGDLHLAEDALQDALLAAATAWAVDGPRPTRRRGCTRTGRRSSRSTAS